MADPAPLQIGLVHSPFGWALWNREEFSEDDAAVRYVQLRALEDVLRRLDGAASVERRGAAHFIREQLQL